MELHKTLERKLKRIGLSTALAPNQEQWEDFIKYINNTYYDTDQERYLLQRSMEVSSSEMLDLNEKLEKAQRIAHLGYWQLEKITSKPIWSKELYNIMGVDPSQPPPNFEQILEFTYEQDQPIIKELVERAFAEGENYECEIRILNKQDNIYHWYYAKGEATYNQEIKSFTLSGIIIDITKRKEIEEEIALLNQKLITSARQAGMADVATSILHNIGNVLNSTNVSVGTLQENIHKPSFKKLFTVIGLIKENLSSLTEYLTNDPKGKLIPEYLITLNEVLQNDYKIFSDETENLFKSLHHIKEIVAMQQSISKIGGISQKFFLPEIIDNAIAISGNALQVKNIQLAKEFNQMPFIIADKSNFLQILVNLIQNAKEALIVDSTNQNKQILITLNTIEDQKKVILTVKDNGIGISKENLSKIFTFGFTTKPEGHGFGLHNSVLKAKEMGGSLEVDSKGEGEGAVFTLTLPLSDKD